MAPARTQHEHEVSNPQTPLPNPKGARQHPLWMGLGFPKKALCTFAKPSFTPSKKVSDAVPHPSLPVTQDSDDSIEELGGHAAPACLAELPDDQDDADGDEVSNVQS